MRDLHQALKFEEVGKARAPSAGVDFVVIRSQWGKEDFGFGLHAAPNQFTTSGIQTPDFLALLGFERFHCQFTGRSECFARAIEQQFDLNSFAKQFDTAFEAFRQAERHLESCGIFFEQLEGWGYFYGTRSRGRTRRSFAEFGDGHTVSKSEEMKRSEDGAFHFAFVWVVTARGDKGWTTHYRPKNPPLSVELESVFRFLGLKAFPNCPCSDFEPCSWSGLLYEKWGESPFDRNTKTAHQWFGNHAQHFSPGIENLLRAHASMEPFGMKLLPFADLKERLRQEIERHTTRPEKAGKAAAEGAFDVALSFAGTEREPAELLATLVRDAGFSVFYDKFYPEDLWGKDLVETFYEIYSKRARYCVIFVSDEYNTRSWTIHERRSAQERMLRERGQEYILPVKANDVELPGMPTTIGYVSLRELGVEKIAKLLIKKLQK